MIIHPNPQAQAGFAMDKTELYLNSQDLGVEEEPV